MIDDKLLSSLLHDDPLEPFRTMVNIDFTVLKSLNPWPFAANSLQSSPLMPNLFSENQVAERFNVTLRTVRDRARGRNLGRKLSGVRWFTEAEVFSLMDAEAKCWSSKNDTVLNSGPRVARTAESKLTEALALLNEGKPRPSSKNSRKRSSNGQVVAFQKKQGLVSLKR
jgi:hypothetical protein